MISHKHAMRFNLNIGAAKAGAPILTSCDQAGCTRLGGGTRASATADCDGLLPSSGLGGNQVAGQAWISGVRLLDEGG